MPMKLVYFILEVLLQTTIVLFLLTFTAEKCSPLFEGTCCCLLGHVFQLLCTQCQIPCLRSDSPFQTFLAAQISKFSQQPQPWLGGIILVKSQSSDQKDHSSKWLDEYLLIVTEMCCCYVPHAPMTGKILVLLWTSWLYHKRGLNTDDKH